MKIIYACTAIFACILGLYAGSGSAAVLEKEYERVFDFEPSGEFYLANYRGGITVRSGDFQSIEVRAVIKAVHTDEEVAQDILDNVSINVRETSPDFVDIRVDVDRNFLNDIRNEGLSALFRGYQGPLIEVNFNIQVPRSINLDLRTERGPVDIKDIVGKVKVRNHRGSVYIEDIDGAVDAGTERAEMQLTNISGNVEAGNNRGAIRIDRAAGTVNARTERAEILLTQIGRDIEAKSHRGEINIDQAGGTVTAETEQAGIGLKSIAGDISARNHRGAIHIERAEGSISAETERGNISAEIIQVLDGSHFFFQNDKGNITVLLPETMNADASIRISRGEFSSEFPLKIMGTISEKSIEGTINNGGIPLEIHNSRGSVYLKKL